MSLFKGFSVNYRPESAMVERSLRVRKGPGSNPGRIITNVEIPIAILPSARSKRLVLKKMCSQYTS